MVSVGMAVPILIPNVDVRFDVASLFVDLVAGRRLLLKARI